MKPLSFKGTMLLIAFLSVLSTVKATVIITPASGGTNISADKSSGSSQESYTSLGNIVIASNLSSDFSINQSNVSFVLSAPANWVFKPGAGSIAFEGNSITQASISVSASGITVTFSTNSTAAANNRLTISGLEVQCTSKSINSGSIRRTSGTAVISGLTNSASVNCGSLSQVAGNFVKLQLLLPGENVAPGTLTGKTGTPTAQLAGTAFTFTVFAADENWNTISSASDVINITASDAQAAIPSNSTLSSGTRSFTITLRGPGTATITARSVSKPALPTVESSTIAVNTGPFTKLQILLPGETAAPGTTSGKTGTPLAQTAGTPMLVTVNATDAAWNIISTVTDIVGISSNDVNADLPLNANLSSGTQTFSVTLKTAGARTITASNVSDPSKTANTSPSFTLSSAGYSKLQVLLPGETAAPGTLNGKTGSPSVRLAGSSFTFTVNAVDAYWNRVTTVTNVIKISSSDGNATLPANAALSSGSRTNFRITLRTLGRHTISANDITNGSIDTSTSAPATVTTGNFSRLQVLLPGETAAPGTATGKTGTPVAQTAGTPVTVTVNAVDAAWNVVSTVTDLVRITSSDVNAELPPNAPLIAGTRSFNLTLKTAGSRSIVASDFSDPSKTANTSASVTVSPAAFSKLQVLLPGETAAPGTVNGKTGTPSARAAGTAFNFTVNAVDMYWNRVASVNDIISINTTDANATLPANASLSSGTKTNFRMTLKTIGTHTITASNVSNGNITSSTSAPVQVNIGAAYRLQILLPGETAAPGTTTGKTGTPTALTAGVPFDITVNIVDAAWNRITTNSNTVRFTSTDANATLPPQTPLSEGTATFPVTLKTAGARTISVFNVSNGSILSATSGSATVQAAAFNGLQILITGETAAPGTATGKIGNPRIPARGTAFSFTVNAVDAFYNKISSASNLITISTSDAAATVPTSNTLSSGGRNFSITLRTAGVQTITASGASFSTSVQVPDNVEISNATDFFRSVESGSWHDAGTWESSTNGTNWHAATLVPGSAANGISLENGHVVTISSSLTADHLTIKDGAELKVVSGTLSIANGTGTDLDVSGTLSNQSAISSSGTIVFQSTGKYRHLLSTSAGTIPTATWNTGSECEISGYTSATGTIGGSSQNFYDLTWNCPNQNVSGNGPSLGGNFTAVNFTVISTGNGELRLGLGNGTCTVSKQWIQSGGTVTVNGSSNTTVNFNLAGNFSMSGGILQKGSGTGNVNFNGSAVQTFAKTGGTISGAISFTIQNGASVDFGNDVLAGSSASFSLLSGGTFITSHPAGIASSGSSGTIQTQTRTFSSSANYTYNGDEEQISGSGLPLTMNNLKIENPYGLSLPAGSASYTINGALTISSGFLNMGTNALVTGTGFSNSGTGVLYMASTSSTPISAGKTWNIGIEYNGNGNQNIVPGTYSNLSFSGDGIKTLNGSIHVKGDWNSTGGKIDLSTHTTTVTFSGTTQYLRDNGSDEGNGIVFKNLVFSNSGIKTLSSGYFSLSSTGGLLSVTDNATLNANGNLYVLSDENGSGTIGPLNGSADITGNVNVQSFISGNNSEEYRGTRCISSPINDAALSKRTFQQLKDFILVTGPGNIANGFDMGGNANPNNPTFQIYNEPAYSGASIFSAVPHISTSAVPGKGYFMSFRGNRTTPSSKVNAPFAPPEDVTLTYTGPINKRSISLPLTNSNLVPPAYAVADPYNGYNLVGNPYASAIDFHTVLANSSNLENMIVILKPDGGTATYINGESNGGGSRYIQPGQGFYVKVKNGFSSGSIVFTESCKTTSAAPARLLSTPANDRIALNKGGMGSSTATTNTPKKLKILLRDELSADETTVIFSQGNSEEATDDAAYFQGGPVSLSSLSADGKSLSVNFMPDISEVKRMELSVNASSSKAVSLTFTQITAPQGYQAILYDKYLETYTAVSLNSSYSFSIDKSNSKSYGNRFSLLFDKPRLSLLSAFQASLSGSAVALNWKSDEASQVTYFEVQKGTDVQNMQSIVKESPNYFHPSGTSFHYLDPAFGGQKAYYRIKQTNADGSISYSSPELVEAKMLQTRKVLLYPNPAGEVLNLFLFDQEHPSKVTIYSTSGRKVLESRIAEGVSDYRLDISSLPPGSYVAEVIDLKKGEVSGKPKFIKQ